MVPPTAHAEALFVDTLRLKIVGFRSHLFAVFAFKLIAELAKPNAFADTDLGAYSKSVFCFGACRD